MDRKITPYFKWPSTFVTCPISWVFVLEVHEDLNFEVWGSENFFGKGKYFFGRVWSRGPPCTKCGDARLHRNRQHPISKKLVRIFGSTDPPQNRTTASPGLIFSEKNCPGPILRPENSKSEFDFLGALLSKITTEVGIFADISPLPTPVVAACGGEAGKINRSHFLKSGCQMSIQKEKFTNRG